MVNKDEGNEFTMGQNLLHLNGVTYDTRTGKVVSAGPEQTPHTKPLQQHRQTQPVVDGFMKPKRVRQHSQTHSSAHPPVSEVKKPRTQKSQTLARHAVKKPEKNEMIERAAHKSLQPLKTRRLFDFKKAEHASKVQKSEHISRFQNTTGQVAPAHQPKQAQQNKSPQATQPPATAHIQPPKNTPTPQKQSTPLAQAVDQATSHTNTYQDESNPSGIKKTVMWTRRLSNKARYATVALLLLAGFGIIAYSSAPIISYEIASARSGMDVERPAYTPSGFSLSKDVEYQEGSLKLRYTSHSDNRSYTVQKEKTDWNTEALRNDFVEAQGLYQSISSRGKTIYLYEQSHATWIDGGVWYTIKDTAGLSSDQVLRIANSL